MVDMGRRWKLFAVTAETVQLQPMLLDLEPTLSSDSFDQLAQIIPGKVHHLTAARAKQNVFVPISSAQVCMAAVCLVNALHQAQFLQFFQGTVHGYQSQPWVFAPSQVKNIHSFQSPGGIYQDIYNHLEGAGDAVAVGL